jgi:hypothetical protein
MNVVAKWLAVTTWGAVAAAFLAILVHQQMTPGVLQPASPQWSSSLPLHRVPGTYTLIMSVHPQCPCSRASLRELEELLARSNGNVTARVNFVVPKGATAAWAKSGGLWKEAASIPGVDSGIDINGKLAARLGATTSGDVVIYDPAGELMFHGGITDGRGHEGDNIGFDAALATLRGAVSAPATAPVYGCVLTDSAAPGSQEDRN